MLLNLSNHPAGKWSDSQTKTAKEQFGVILDLPFPKIDPSASSDQLLDLADQFILKINEIKKEHQDNITVHVMGEMTFTFALVKKLKTAGIQCIASTTNRLVEEKEGKKIVQFEFVQFRKY